MPITLLSPGSCNDFVSQYKEAEIYAKRDKTAIFSPKHDQSLNTQDDALEETGRSDDEVVHGLGVSQSHGNKGIPHIRLTLASRQRSVITSADFEEYEDNRASYYFNRLEQIGEI